MQAANQACWLQCYRACAIVHAVVEYARGTAAIAARIAVAAAALALAVAVANAVDVVALAVAYTVFSCRP